MFKKIKFVQFALIILTIGLFEFSSNAQIELDDFDPVLSPKKDDKKLPGATVRGRVFYDDTNRPVRYLDISLVQADEEDLNYPEKYIRTDEKGEFTLTDVQAGSYYLYVKSQGFLNPDVYESLEDTDKKQIFESLFQPVSVNDTGTFNFQFRVKRGGAISGVVRYADGEVATDVKVEILRKKGEKFSAYPIGGVAGLSDVKTDDRGYYRFAGLPEGSYTVRVIEPISHKLEQKSDYNLDYGDKEYLKTYYPNAEKAKDADELIVSFGQEQTSIDITIPKRELFDISGRVVLKKTGENLKNFEISFYKIGETDEGLDYGRSLMLGAFDSNFTTSEISSEWTLRSLPKGKYEITARQKSFYGDKDKNQPIYADISKEIEIVDGDIENVLLEVTTGSSIKGFISEQSGKKLPASMSIYAWDESAKNMEQAEIDYSLFDENNPASQKRLPFEINKLTAGKMIISDFGEDYYINKILVGGKEVDDFTINLQEGENLEGVQIVVATNMGTLKGKVTNAEKVRQVAVYLVKKEFRAEPEIAYGEVVENDGSYQFKAAPGEYYVIVRDQSNDDAEESDEEHQRKLRELLNNASTVTIRENETTTLNLNLPKD